MIGQYRFILAFFVAYTHMLVEFNSQKYLGFDFSAGAVVTFYFISGFLITRSYERFVEKAHRPTLSFYFDRVARLYPIFLVVFVLGCIILVAKGKEILNTFTLLELMIMPHSYTSFFKTTNVIPVAWSLGLEFHFYALLPAIFLLKNKTKLYLIFLLFLLQTLAFNIGGGARDYPLVDSFCTWSFVSQSYLCSTNISQIVGYSLMPVPIMYFILGNMLFSDKNLFRKVFPVFILVNIMSLVFSAESGALGNYLVDEIYIGVLIFLPLAYVVLEHHKNSKFDKFIGNLAYPLFLVHYPVIWFVRDLAGLNFMFILTLAISLLLAYALTIFQFRIDKVRYSYRGFGGVGK